MKIMRKKRFRIVGMLLAFVTAFSLVACGSDQGGAPGNEVVNSESGASGNSDANSESGASGNVDSNSGESAGGEDSDASEDTNFELSAELQADREIKTAYDMGLLSRELVEEMDRTVTFQECSKLLYRMLAFRDESEAEGWKEKEALCFASEDPLRRGDAIILFYSAARVLGWPILMSPEDYNLTPGEYEALNDLGMIPGRPEGSPRTNALTNTEFYMLLDDLLYPWWDNNGWEDYSLSQNFSDLDYPDVAWGLRNNAFAFAVGQRSNISNRSLFDLDREDMSKPLDPERGVTVEEAVRATVRLYESVDAKISASEREAIDRETDARREAILNSPTAIVQASEYIPGETYSGTAYYVSGDGDDANDGLTPETAFRTAEKVNSLNLKKGDAVFFRRGDIWREQLICRESVTYSAYGEGRKPRFYGSKESGVGAEKWELYYDGQGSEKIWKYYRELPDTGGIVFNDGESYALRVYGWWSAEKRCHVRLEDTDKEFLPEERLLEGGDLVFCSLVDFGDKQYPFARYMYDDKGGLYLRCDRGNPGAIYEEIEFENSEGLIGWCCILDIDECAVAETVIDNLAVMYWGNRATGNGANQESLIVQNCEVAWGGNCIHEIIQAEPTIGYMLSGDGIYFSSAGGMTVTNCYVHDVDGCGITYEGYPAPSQSTITGNLIEHCGQGISLVTSEAPGLYEPILIEDNYVLDIGVGNVHGCFCSHWGIALYGLGEQHATATIRDNLICNVLHASIDGLTGQEILENNRLYR